MSTDIVSKTTNEITKTWLSGEDKKLIRSQFFPKQATDQEMVYCMKVAESFNLNPILKQIYFVPRRSKVDGKWIEKVEPLAGRDSFLILARRTGMFKHITSRVEIRSVPLLKDKKWQMVDDLVGIAEVKRTDTDEVFVVEVCYHEYAQKTHDGSVTKFWKEKPQTMIKKVAESQCLRRAFDVLCGLYDENEIQRDVEVQATTEDVPAGLGLRKDFVEEKPVEVKEVSSDS